MYAHARRLALDFHCLRAFAEESVHLPGRRMGCLLSIRISVDHVGLGRLTDVALIISYLCVFGNRVTYILSCLHSECSVHPGHLQKF